MNLFSWKNENPLKHIFHWSTKSLLISGHYKFILWFNGITKKKKEFEVFWANNLKPSLKGNNFKPSTILTQIINKILTVIMQLSFGLVTKTYFFWGSLGSLCSCVLRDIIWHVAKNDKHLVSRLNFNTQLTNAVKTDQNLLLLIIK